MQPSSSHAAAKHKSGIPQPVSKKTKTTSNQSHAEHQQIDEHKSQNSSRDPPEVISSTQHPLAAAMNKKKAVKKNPISESWADMKIESQSQKMNNQSQSDSSRRKQDIEKQLREAEIQLGEMSELLEKRERMLEEEKSGADSKIKDLEDRLMDQEGILAEHGIDPVTGQKLTPSDEDKKKVEVTKKITKKTVQAMREKLQEMNRQTESFLADIENTMHYLASLEDASERAGPFSEETQAMIARIGGDEEAIKKVYDENAVPELVPNKNSVSFAYRESDEEDDAESQKGGEKAAGDSAQFFITDATDCDEGIVETEQVDVEGSVCLK
ncbi:hypothetical protein PoB_001215300 [Plakobranchus ocellatus]|uniref:Uncharacterized protein n=1 Tax=Plakobranchus ocellatus TaxID=259542 RepID=A0AAV3YTE9_9GAST|nr:hypothetical protein PoB_001215300 [Plakobranchus ocellatus]